MAELNGDVPQAQGMELVSVALELMRDVKRGMERMENKIDAISAERREEAREQGNMDARVTALEKANADHEHSVQVARQLAIGALISVGLGILGFVGWIIVRLIAQVPTVIGR